MKTEPTRYDRLSGKGLILLGIVGLLSLTLLSINCKDKPLVESTSDYLDLIRYLEVNEDGRSLFRTEGLIDDQTYTKPNRPGVEFRDSLESVTRIYTGEIPGTGETRGDEVEKNFGAPFGIVDDAEFVITDKFRIQILADSADTQWLDNIQERTLHRRAYFLRLRSERDAYGGWLLHGYNGGTPRGQAGMEIKRSNGSMFLGDGLDYQYIEYDKYTTHYWPNRWSTLDSITVDTTLRVRTADPYILMQDIARVTEGDELSILSFANDTSVTTSRSVYQIVSAETETGPVYRSMHGPDDGTYNDTIRTPVATNVIWNIIFFQEFQFVDRPGGMWCVPYRVQ